MERTNASPIFWRLPRSRPSVLAGRNSAVLLVRSAEWAIAGRTHERRRHVVRNAPEQWMVGANPFEGTDQQRRQRHVSEHNESRCSVFRQRSFSPATTTRV